MTNWNDPTVITATMSAIAAIAAAIATWRAPLSAARMSEQLRKLSDQLADQRHFKFNLFTTLMQERSEIYSIESVRALNSIDVAYSDAPTVREAWAELYQILNQATIPPGHVLDERLRKLLREMAFDLGLSDRLRLDDFGRIYFPNAIKDERHVRDIKRQRELEQLTGGSVAQKNGETPLTKWPPAPQPDGTPS